MRYLYTAIVLLCSGAAYGQADFFSRLADSAMVLTQDHVQYDAAYVRIGYPNGDVPADKGVCTDVIIRAYRKLGIDLQRLVHEDMRSNFSLYPKNWGLTRPDRNIDHRRVPNLMTFFTRFGSVKKITDDPSDYLPGDVVCWDIGGNTTHIGIVVKAKSSDGERHLVVHNIGGGQVAEDMLFEYRVIGHYRFKKYISER